MHSPAFQKNEETGLQIESYLKMLYGVKRPVNRKE